MGIVAILFPQIYGKAEYIDSAKISAAQPGRAACLIFAPGGNGAQKAGCGVPRAARSRRGTGSIMHVTGEPDGPPTSLGIPICDLGTGMWAVQGILAALYERWHTGKSRLVECWLLETAIGFSSWTSAQ
jgi:hypothetical protein